MLQAAWRHQEHGHCPAAALAELVMSVAIRREDKARFLCMCLPGWVAIGILKLAGNQLTPSQLQVMLQLAQI